MTQNVDSRRLSRTRQRGERQRIQATNAPVSDVEVPRNQGRRSERQRQHVNTAKDVVIDAQRTHRTPVVRQRVSVTQPTYAADQSLAQEQTAKILDQSKIVPSLPSAAPSIPVTSFTCADKIKGGFYADVEADCTVFHICSQGRHNR